MNVTIENPIKTEEQLEAVNSLVEQCKIEGINFKDISKCLYSNKDYETLIHGYSGSHFWLSEKESGKRILIIIE